MLPTRISTWYYTWSCRSSPFNYGFCNRNAESWALSRLHYPMKVALI